ncbi:MAG: hypothetical protein ABUL47_05285 [Leifsonia sp.]|jgi:ribosomal protein S1
MNVTHPTIGAVEDVVVTKKTPFGVLVERPDGMAGLVTGADAVEGATISVTISEVDLVEQRFSATPR